ncbi:MAG: hypothetical protein E7577_02510 [Ruminococcaceae bacterium]|nr:hypothetical protein [Oscillospiraceae bacterium]
MKLSIGISIIFVVATTLLAYGAMLLMLGVNGDLSPLNVKAFLLVSVAALIMFLFGALLISLVFLDQIL